MKMSGTIQQTQANLASIVGRRVGDNYLKNLKWLVGVVGTAAKFEKRIDELLTPGSALIWELTVFMNWDPTIFRGDFAEMREAWERVKYAIERLGSGSEACELEISGKVQC